jgi:hypothetical protein
MRRLGIIRAASATEIANDFSSQYVSHIDTYEAETVMMNGAASNQLTPDLEHWPGSRPQTAPCDEKRPSGRIACGVCGTKNAIGRNPGLIEIQLQK